MIFKNLTLCTVLYDVDKETETYSELLLKSGLYMNNKELMISRSVNQLTFNNR